MLVPIILGILTSSATISFYGSIVHYRDGFEPGPEIPYIADQLHMIPRAASVAMDKARKAAILSAIT
jgi:hypothetical protein